jgi:hypothetical protein
MMDDVKEKPVDTSVSKRMLFAQALGLALTSGLASRLATGSAEAASKGDREKAMKFTDAFSRQFMEQFDKNGGTAKPGIAPPWVHHLVDNVWDYFFGR